MQFTSLFRLFVTLLIIFINTNDLLNEVKLNRRLCAMGFQTFTFIPVRSPSEAKGKWSEKMRPGKFSAHNNIVCSMWKYKFDLWHNILLFWHGDRRHNAPSSFMETLISKLHVILFLFRLFFFFFRNTQKAWRIPHWKLKTFYLGPLETRHLKCRLVFDGKIK